MKKRLLLNIVLAVIFLSVSASAQLTVNKIETAPVIIAELDNPAVFDLVINNDEEPEEIQIYSLIGINIAPRLSFNIDSGENRVQIKVFVPKEMRKYTGYFRFEYQIKGEKSGIYKDTLRVKIVPLKDALAFSAKSFNIDDSSAAILVRNKEETYLDNITVHFKSLFFNEIKKISLVPSEVIEVNLPVENDKIKTFSAGPYRFKADVQYEGIEAGFEGIINYLENENINVISSSEGFIIRKSTVTKTNEGNVPSLARIEKKQDIISRLFTVHSMEPMEVDRRGFFVYYTWEKSLDPSESFTVRSTTNYTLPLVILGFIIAIAVFVSIMLKTSVVLNKRVSFVRAKGGEFALKVRVHVKAKKYVENIQVVDRLPGMATLYEKFGIKPDVIDTSNRRLIWKIPRLNTGEERIFSYIIYSKIKVVGRFELPSAMAIFEREGKIQEASSNRAFFVADTAKEIEYE